VHTTQYHSVTTIAEKYSVSDLNRVHVNICAIKLFGQGRGRGQPCKNFKLHWSPCRIWSLLLISLVPM